MVAVLSVEVATGILPVSPPTVVVVLKMFSPDMVPVAPFKDKTPLFATVVLPMPPLDTVMPVPADKVVVVLKMLRPVIAPVRPLIEVVVLKLGAELITVIVPGDVVEIVIPAPLAKV